MNSRSGSSPSREVAIHRAVLEQVVVAAVASILAACGTLAPSTAFPVKPASEYAVSQRAGAVTVGVDPLTTEEQVLQWFGSDLTRDGLIAVHVAIENDRESSESIIVLKDQFAIGERRAESRVAAGLELPKTEASLAEKEMGAIRGLFGMGILGAISGWYEAEARHLRDQSVLQNRITEVRLRTETLRPGDSVRGFVFFRIQPDWNEKSTLTFAFNAATQAGKNALFLIDLAADKRPYMSPQK